MDLLAIHKVPVSVLHGQELWDYEMQSQYHMYHCRFADNIII